MNENRIKNAFETMNTTEEMDKKILAAVCASQNDGQRRTPKRSRRFYRSMALAAAIVLTVFTVLQIPQVATYAETVFDGFKKIFFVQGEEVELEGEYIKISEDASKAWKKNNGLAKIEDNLNIKLLKYDECYEDAHSWIYYAGMLEGDKGPIQEVTLTNHYYILGDLKEVKTNVYGNPMQMNGISYTSGKFFKTPVSCQITFYTEAKAEKGGVISDEEIITDFDNAKATKYWCENLETDVLIYKVETDGPAAWNQVRVREMTDMVIVYDGIQYNFLGEVSTDTMKKIADSLHY